MENEQLEFDFMIKGNQNFEGVGMNPEDFTVVTTSNTGSPAVGSIVLGSGSAGGGGVLSNGGLNSPFKATRYVDEDKHRREIILLLQVQFPETYKQIMDALKARDALVDGQW